MQVLRKDNEGRDGKVRIRGSFRITPWDPWGSPDHRFRTAALELRCSDQLALEFGRETQIIWGLSQS